MSTELSWREQLKRQLPLLGHRNWIVIADSAYPLQTAPGVETICTGEVHLDVVEAVLEAVNLAPHVQARIYLDAELPFLTEEDASGISQYCEEIKGLFTGETVRMLPHDDIIAKLDMAGQTFQILLLKTTLTLPYTSVFLELDCGYWNAAAEDRLRKAVAKR